MKLEYLPDGAERCPLVRIFEFDAAAARRLHDTFCSLAAGSIQHIRLDDVLRVDPVDGCRLSFTRGTQDRGVIQLGRQDFDVVLTGSGWEQTAGLAEPFRDNCSVGYQWLTEHAGNIQLLFSPHGDW
jgi:hypothetical protein